MKYCVKKVSIQTSLIPYRIYKPKNRVTIRYKK